jgi:aspartyl-tRNA(Asn)/glutamyl-tRNA(Gln) amidotransferase subunit B
MKMKTLINKLKVRQIIALSFRRLSSVSQKSIEMIDENELNNKFSQYESVIGLEVHAQIASKSKLFSSSGTSYTSPPNSEVSFFDTALPGTLPVLNRRCVEAAIITGLALNCQIAKRSLFDRKHYFYADMPAGYQITQQRDPIARNGFIEFIVHNEYSNRKPYLKRSNLKQIQLEQDSGKSLQDETNNRSLVDLNRAGIALMEFVFEPDLRSADEAVCLVRELVLILKQIKTCTCKMEEGVLRVDANISVHQHNQPFGVRTEVKNLNSFRFIQNAIQYEISRQISLIQSGGHVVNETRMYDMKLRQTFPMRDKEVVQDYRFMPEPNLPPLLLCDDNDPNPDLINISNFKKEIKQLPNELRENLLKTYNLNLEQIFTLMNDNGMTEIFIEIANHSKSKKFDTIFAFINFELRTVLNDSKLNFRSCAVSTNIISEIIDMFVNEEISLGTATDLLGLYFQNETRTPKQIVHEFNWKVIKDKEMIKKICLQTIEMYPKIARRYAKSGLRKPKSVLIQHVLTLLENKVNINQIWDIFDELLRSDKK